VEVHFSLDIQKCLLALAETGRFGRTSEAVVEYFIQNRIFLLTDVKRFTIRGLIMLGYDDFLIIRTVPGGRIQNAKTLDSVKRDWDIYSKKPSEQKNDDSD